MFEWVPRTLSGSLAHVGGAHGVDLAGLALGQLLVLSKKVHCMSLSSIHILYNHTPTERLKPNPEPWYGFTYFHCPEVVLFCVRAQPHKNNARATRALSRTLTHSRCSFSSRHARARRLATHSPGDCGQPRDSTREENVLASSTLV